MGACYCWLCLGVDCFGGRFSVSTGSFPDGPLRERSSEGLSKGHLQCFPSGYCFVGSDGPRGQSY